MTDIQSSTHSFHIFTLFFAFLLPCFPKCAVTVFGPVYGQSRFIPAAEALVPGKTSGALVPSALLLLVEGVLPEEPQGGGQAVWRVLQAALRNSPCTTLLLCYFGFSETICLCSFPKGNWR